MRGSSGQARETLRRHFAELQAAAARLLAERLGVLMAEVDAIEADSIKPLDDCQSLIEHGVGQADELLREGGGVVAAAAPPTLAAGSNKRAVTSAGEAALRTSLDEKEDKLGSFTKKALQIQLDRWGRRRSTAAGGGVWVLTLCVLQPARGPGAGGRSVCFCPAGRLAAEPLQGRRVPPRRCLLPPPRPDRGAAGAARRHPGALV